MDAGASRKYVELSNDEVGISVWIHESAAFLLVAPPARTCGS